MVLRSIVRISEEMCNGCGVCIPACAEGAIRIVDGKARLISDKYCDGLGACLGECPQEALTIEERETVDFDEKAVEAHLQRRPPVARAHQARAHQSHASCPSAKVMHLERTLSGKETAKPSEKRESTLSQWPVQLTLVPPSASFFENADLLVVADCVPFAYADFHNDFLKEQKLVVGCPKLDNVSVYKEKLTEIFKQSNIQSLTVVNMEVPCCFGLYRLVKEALEVSGKDIPLRQQTISIKGENVGGHT